MKLDFMDMYLECVHTMDIIERNQAASNRHTFFTVIVGVLGHGG